MHPTRFLLAATFLVVFSLRANATQGQEASPSDLLPSPPPAAGQTVPAGEADDDFQTPGMPGDTELPQFIPSDTAPDSLSASCLCTRYAGHLGILPPEPVEPPVILRPVPVRELLWPVIDQADFQWMWVPD